MLFVIYLSFLVMSSMAQVPGLGPCEEVEGIPDFNATEFLGRWYGYAEYPLISYPEKCRKAMVSLNPNGTLTSAIEQLSDTRSDVRVEEITLLLSHNGSDFTFVGPEYSEWYNISFKMISTDYVSYVIKGFCSNVGPSSLNYYFIETRSRHPSQDVVEQIQQVLNDKNIPQQYFVLTNQDDCPDNF